MKGHFYGQVFQDSDVYKWLEAVGNILMLERDPELEEKADSVIDLIAEAQEEDGYLDTYFPLRNRIKNGRMYWNAMSSIVPDILLKVQYPITGQQERRKSFRLLINWRIIWTEFLALRKVASWLSGTSGNRDCLVKAL